MATMKQVEIRQNGTKRVYTVNTEADMADQSFKMDCDVNFIVQKYLKTGQITHLAKNVGKYMDVSEIPDLQTALTTVQKAQEAFDSLPAELRARFANSPVEMVNWLQDPQNDEEAIRLGLKVKIDSPPGSESPAPAGDPKASGSAPGTEKK